MRALVGAAGIAAPIAAGMLVGHAGIGMAMGLGGLALCGREEKLSLGEEALGLLGCMLAGASAMYAGACLGGRGLWAILGPPLVIAAAALFGGISRPLARSSGLFAVFALIAAGLGRGTIAPLSLTLLFLAGAAWTAALSLALWRWTRPSAASPDAREEAPRRSAAQLLKRWLKTLASPAGWRYPLRLFLCLVSAEALVLAWPFARAYWIPLTAAIVLPRRLDSGMERAVHRAIGTSLGVILAIGLGLLSLSPLATIAAIALLAAARSILRPFSYIAYATAHTPLILALMDLGGGPSPAILGLDRLAATMAGCAAAFLVGYLPWRLSPFRDCG